MLSVVAPSHCEPSGYELNDTFPVPVVVEAYDVIIKVHAASVNPIDVKKATGLFKIAIKETYILRKDVWN